jgi:hypothetical protein
MVIVSGLSHDRSKGSPEDTAFVLDRVLITFSPFSGGVFRQTDLQPQHANVL